jgi:tetratricopeptide (TPR) repeat protein
LNGGSPNIRDFPFFKGLKSPKITQELKCKALGQLGRINAKNKKFDEAISYWEQQLELNDTLSAVEKAWLNHDIARCCIELGQQEKCKTLAEYSCNFALESNEAKWILNSHVLLGQVFGMLHRQRQVRY